MKEANVKGTDPPYWDDGNRKMFPWFQKGFWKRHFRKRFLKARMKEIEKTGDKETYDTFNRIKNGEMDHLTKPIKW